MNLPTQAQVYAALRYIGTSAGTVGSIVVLVGLLPQDQSAALVASFQQVVNDLVQLFGDTWKFVLLAIPVVTVWLAKIGYSSASPKSQIAAVQALPQAQVTVTDPKLAEGIPGVKVGPGLFHNQPKGNDHA